VWELGGEEGGGRKEGGRREAVVAEQEKEAEMIGIETRVRRWRSEPTALLPSTALLP